MQLLCAALVEAPASVRLQLGCAQCAPTVPHNLT
jgi:hypothetical protein